VNHAGGLKENARDHARGLKENGRVITLGDLKRGVWGREVSPQGDLKRIV